MEREMLTFTPGQPRLATALGLTEGRSRAWLLSNSADLHTGPWGKAPTPDIGIPGPRELPIGTFSNIQKRSWAQIVTMALSVTVKDWRSDTNKTVPSETVRVSPGGDGDGDVSVWHTQIIRSPHRQAGKSGSALNAQISVVSSSAQRPSGARLLTLA